MPRIAPVSTADATDQVREVFDACEATSGKLLTPIAVAARSPGVMQAMIGFELSARAADQLSEPVKRLVELKVATLLGCPHGIDIGTALGLDAGIAVQLLEELPRFRESQVFSIAELAVLEYCEAMTQGVEIDDGLFDELRQHFDEAQLVELTAAIAWANYRARFNLALGIEQQGFCSARRASAREFTAQAARS